MHFLPVAQADSCRWVSYRSCLHESPSSDSRIPRGPKLMPRSRTFQSLLRGYRWPKRTLQSMLIHRQPLDLVQSIGLVWQLHDVH